MQSPDLLINCAELCALGRHLLNRLNLVSEKRKQDQGGWACLWQEVALLRVVHMSKGIWQGLEQEGKGTSTHLSTCHVPGPWRQMWKQEGACGYTPENSLSLYAARSGESSSHWPSRPLPPLATR